MRAYPWKSPRRHMKKQKTKTKTKTKKTALISNRGKTALLSLKVMENATLYLMCITL